jgi:outer membrane protein assembly factor BamA
MKCYPILVLLFFSLTVFGQQTKLISFSGDNLSGITKQSPIKVTDSLSMVRILEQLKLKAIRKGFLLASFDSIYPTKEGWNATFYQGNEFKTLQLITDEETTYFLRKHGRLTDQMLSTVPLRPTEFGKMVEVILSCYLNNGYPFAQIAFTSIEYGDNTCSAKLSIEKGLYLNFSQIHLKGDTAVSSRFISSLIDLSEGEPFNEEKLNLISAKLKQVPFIKEIKPHELLFSTDGVELFMYLETNTVSSVNGAVGIQPDPVSERVGLTGELNLKLLNQLYCT